MTYRPYPPSVFAAMTAGNIDPRNEGRSTVAPDLDQATAAGMCAGMPDLPFMAAMLKYARDVSQAEFLKYRLWIAAVDICNEEGWKIVKGREYLRKMSELAILEVLDPWQWKQDKDKAAYLGMSSVQFCTTWKKRYESVYRVLHEWAQDGYRYVQVKNTEV